MHNLFRQMSEVPRSVVWVILFALCIWVLNTGLVFASVNQEISYQATLKDSLAHTVSDGNYNIRFKLYATSTGGSPLWSEEWCKGACNGGAGTDNRVSVSSGLLSLQLGQLTSLSTVDFNQALYLGVEVGGASASATWDGEMTPRKKIGSAAGAFNSDKLNGQAASYYLDANNLSNFNSKWASVFSGTTTNALAEGTINKYYTDTRARAALSSGTLSLTYSTSTGIFTISDASTTSSGLVTTGTQSFAGAKTFTGNMTGNGSLTILNTASLATTSISGNLGIGVVANDDRLTVSGTLGLGHFQAGTSLTSTTGYGKLYTKDATGDGNDAYTKILLHFDGSDGGATVTDSSSSQLPFTANSGAKTVSSPVHFGTGILSLNGTSSYVASAAALDFSVASQQDEVDVWVYPTSTSGLRPIHYTGLDSTSTYYAMYLNSGVPTFQLQKDGGPVEVTLASSSSIPINSWTHLALTRKQTGSLYVFSLFVGGSVVATGSATTTLGTTGNTVCLGSDACFGGTNFFAGYLDELRFSRGLMRYSASFTPNTSPYGSGLFYLLGNGAVNEVGGGGGGGGAGGATVDTTSFHKSGDSFGTLASFGLQDNFGLNFITNNTSRLSITNDGKVGIGTTTPDTLLTVAGAARFTGGLTLLGLTGGILTVDASGTVSTTTSSVATTNLLSSVANIITSSVNGISATSTAVNSNVLTWSGNRITSTVNGVGTSTGLSYADASTDGLVSSSTQSFGGQKTFGGKVTASTTGNIVPFTFINQAAFPNATTYRGAIAESDGDGAMFFAYGGVWTQLLDSATGFKNGGSSFSALATLGTNDAFALRFISSSTEAMRITTAGKVGIGTSSPLALLDVYGDGILEGSNRYLNFGTATGTAGYGLRDNGGTLQFKNLSGSWTNVATSTDGLAEGGTNLYYTDARARNAISTTATGLAYSTSTGVLSLTNGYSLLNSNSSQTISGDKTLSGALVVQGTSTLATTTITNLTVSGLGTFNGAVSLGSTLGVTGTSTLATTTATKFTASGASTLSSTLTLGALTGGLLQTDSSGVVSTTSIASLTTHTVSSSANVFTSIVNGVTGTTSIINTNALSWSGQTLTSTINGIATTTLISYANATTDGLMSSSTQTFGGAKTFNGAASLGSTLSVTGTSTFATTTTTLFTASGASTLSAGLTLSALGGGLLQTSAGGVVSTTSIGALTTNSLSWSGSTLSSTVNGILATVGLSYANATTDGLMSSSTQTFGGAKTFNGALSLASVLSVTGTSTFATTTATQFTASGASTLSAALTLSALAGGLLQTSGGGIVSTTSLASLITNSLTSSVNVITSAINGVTSTTTAVNSVAPTSSGNTLTSNVNGVTGTTTIINSNALSWSGQTLTSAINGIATTTTISLASSTADGLMSTTTQVFAGSKTFSSSPTFSTMTAGSVLFAGVGGLVSQSNSSLFWDNTNSRLGIGTTTPSGALSYAGLEYGFIGGNGNISQIATVSVGSSPVGAAIAGKYMYVANSGTSTISVIDIVNPTSPTSIATVDVGGSGPLNVLVSGQYIFTTNNGSSTFSVLDAGNPGNPRLIATTSIGASPRNEAMSGHYVYTTNNASNTISVVDVTNPYSPRQVATTSVGTAPRGIATLGQYAYVANATDNTISVVNISNPLAPSQVATTSTGGGDPRNIFIAGRYAYVANFASSTLAVIDISNPLAPTRVATTSVGTNPQGVSLGGRYAYVGNAGSNSISVVDISSPLSPRSIATTSVGTGPTQLRVNGRYVYVMNTTAGTVSVVDVGGADLGNLYAGSLETGGLQTLSDIVAQGNVNVGSSLFVGPGGIQSGGGLSITSTTSISAFMGKFGIGTTTPTSALTVVGTSTLASTTVTMFTASDGVTVSSMSAGSIIFATSSGLLSQNNTKFFWDDANNRLGIGTSTPSVSLHVISNTIRLNDNQSTAPTRNNPGEIGIGATGTGSANGRIWIRAGTTATNFVFNSTGTGDFSEFFRSTDSTLRTGEVIALNILVGSDASSTRYVARSSQSYDAHILGIVARPGEGTQNNNSREGDREDDHTYKNISLLGQTPVFVSDENGLVTAGDRLTSASHPGYAMKMTHGGMSIGYALSSATTSDQLIEAYVDTGQFMTPEEAGLVSELVSTSTNVSLDSALGGLYRHLIAWFASAANGIGDFFARRIVTQEICVSDTSGARSCIDKQGFDSLLSGTHVSQTVLQGAATTTGTGVSSAATTTPAATSTDSISSEATSTQSSGGPSGGSATTTSVTSTSIPPVSPGGGGSQVSTSTPPDTGTGGTQISTPTPSASSTSP